MSGYAQTVVIVGHVHCYMTYHTIARALGYRPDNVLYFTWRQVQEVYEELKHSNDPLYLAWGPDWEEAASGYHVTDTILARRKDVIREGLRRSEFVERQIELRHKETARRMRAWQRILGVDEAAFDNENIKWNALAEKRT